MEEDIENCARRLLNSLGGKSVIEEYLRIYDSFGNYLQELVNIKSRSYYPAIKSHMLSNTGINLDKLVENNLRILKIGDDVKEDLEKEADDYKRLLIEKVPFEDSLMMLETLVQNLKLLNHFLNPPGLKNKLLYLGIRRAYKINIKIPKRDLEKLIETLERDGREILYEIYS